MKNKQVTLFTLLLFVVGISMLWEYFPKANSDDRLAQLCKGGWRLQSEDIPLSSEEFSRLGGAQAVKRIYRSDAGMWILSAIDGTHNRRVVHDPTYCFRGGGWDVTGQRELPLENGDAKILELTRNGEHLEFAYWFDDGIHTFSSPLEYWLRSTLRRLTCGLSGKEPILLILYPASGGRSPDWDGASLKLIPRIVEERK